MRKDFYKYFYENYEGSHDFRKWQNALTQKAYAALISNLGGNEVSMVTSFCNALNSEGFKGVTISTAKIHGSKSYVDFDYKGASTKKELADMVIISLVTFNGEIVIQKVALVQNKKWNPRDANWNIDQEQLYLLMNFPTFSGLSKRLGKVQDNVFINYTNHLGNYGLFANDGDFILATAKTVFCQQTDYYLKFDDLKKSASTSGNNGSRLLFTDSLFWEDYYYLHKHFGNLPWVGFSPINSCDVSLNMHEFIRNMTHLNIGEPSTLFGNVRDINLQNFAEKILYSAFGHNGNDMKFRTNLWDEGVENEFVVLKVHMEIGENYG